MRGANAAVVGVLLAAFYQPVWTSGITSLRPAALALAALGALQVAPAVGRRSRGGRPWTGLSLKQDAGPAAVFQETSAG